MRDDVSSEARRTSRPSGDSFAFGPFEFDAAAGILYQGEQETLLPPKAAGVLEVLLERPGQLVAKDQLLDRVWEDTHVTESVLTDAISLLRQALGDDAHDPTYIQTIHRRGYRFVAGVERRAAGLPDRHAGAEHAGEAQQKATVAEAPPAGRRILHERLRLKQAIPWTLAALVTVAASLAFWIATRPSGGTSKSVLERRTWTILLPEGAVLERGVQQGGYLALSPDGELLVYAARANGIQQLHLMPIGQPEAARPLRGTEGAYHPFFSPDGEWIGFFAHSELKKVSIEGGLPQTVCQLRGGFDGSGAAWHPEGMIYFTEYGRAPLYRVSESGGEPQLVAEPEAGSFWYMNLLPDGSALLVDRGGPRRVELLALDAANAVELARDVSDPRYLSTGHLVFANPVGPQPNKTLYAVPFDLTTHTLTGPPQPILENVLGYPSGIAQFSVSDNGTLAYVAATGALTPVWVDRRGIETSLRVEEERFGIPNVLSPDERQILTNNFAGEIWIYDIGSDAWRRVVDREETEPLPITTIQITRATWAHDGKSIFLGSPRGLYRRRLDDSTAEPELLIAVEAAPEGTPRGGPFNLTSSRDGKFIAYQLRGQNLWVLPLDGDRIPVAVGSGLLPTWSPNGKWITYEGTEAGTHGIWARPFPVPGNPTLIDEGGEGMHSVRWRADGKELFYLTGRGEMWAVEVLEIRPELRLGRRQLLFQGPYPARYGSFSWDVTADGQRFLLKKEDLTHITIVQNWFVDVKRRLGTGQ